MPFSDNQGHQNTPLPETQPKVTTAQTKVSPVSAEDVPFEEKEIFVVGRSKGQIKMYIELREMDC